MLATVVLALVASTSTSNVDIDALKAAAKEAAAAEKWCDAHGYFQALFARTGELKHLYNAAEVARTAKDNVGALAAYRSVAQRATPDFPERDRVARAVTELEAALAAGDLGAACAAPPPLAAIATETPAASTPSPAPSPAPAPAPSSTPAPVVEERATPPLVIGGAVLAGSGVIVGVGLGVYALALENNLRVPAPGVTREEKDAALEVGWPVVLGATAGFVVSGVGAGLIVMGLE